ncbi:alpha/beta-hydrolase [Coemansia reversa NRRL 1564]|uniref:Alpha/beta-hydrolase n=1 Tax=Coemansia reversa (strain ATCC 12441 / NRRL 1564) TaxID=763665 RepID=A0A2G5BGY5_COERN|nr:alpha/beta-hydrolase [Coemansia reversa NRRL 1564]|eukprot:PIA18242.1 alpha/beta-hydrolase [Coemansia reversa NRRL 1564]
MSALTKQAAPYGCWESPFTAEVVASASSSVSMARVDPANPTRVYWLESRPSEGGRVVLLSKDVDDYSEKTLRVLTSEAKWDVRSAVNGYGGSAYSVYDGLVIFVNWVDQGVYILDTNSIKLEPKRIGEQEEELYYASFSINRSKKFAVCVCEDRRKKDLGTTYKLVAIPLITEFEKIKASDLPQYPMDVVLFSDADFVSSPVLNPVNDEIAFFSWSQPYMNWDRTTLHRGTLLLDSDGIPCSVNLIEVAGMLADDAESIYQPRFDEDSLLHFLSDRGGFWNPYFVDPDGNVQPSLAMPMQVEFADSEWALGQSTFQPVPERKFSMAVTYALGGNRSLGILNVATQTIEDLPIPGWTTLDSLQVGKSHSGEPVLVMIAGGPTESPSLFTYFINGISTNNLLSHGAGDRHDLVDAYQGFVSVPREIIFPTKLPPFDSPQSQNSKAYGYFYPPTNKAYEGVKGELPPLIVLCHGGPTLCAFPVYQPQILYWTSRGFAVIDVNYGGSTGYGREYRNRILTHYGEVDVRDCCAAALHLAELGLVDRKRLCIMGESSGGFTTLSCMAFRPEVFAVGASLYGISDLEALVKGNPPMFEAKYFERLLGSYSSMRSVYIKRSPLNATDSLKNPVIFMHGLDDEIVPPSQTAQMVAALKKKGRRVAHIELEKEGHGFIQAKNIKLALEARLYFFGRMLGFKPADNIEPIPILNDGEAV